MHPHLGFFYRPHEFAIGYALALGAFAVATLALAVCMACGVG